MGKCNILVFRTNLFHCGRQTVDRWRRLRRWPIRLGSFACRPMGSRRCRLARQRLRRRAPRPTRPLWTVSVAICWTASGRAERNRKRTGCPWPPSLCHVWLARPPGCTPRTFGRQRRCPAKMHITSQIIITVSLLILGII